MDATPRLSTAINLICEQCIEVEAVKDAAGSQVYGDGPEAMHAGEDSATGGRCSNINLA